MADRETPLELGLDWIVDFKKPHFNGRSALLKQKKEGSKYKLLKLDIEGNKVAEGATLYNNEACSYEIGYVTSAMWSPAVKANIAYAMVESKALGGGDLGRDLPLQGTASDPQDGSVYRERQAILGASTFTANSAGTDLTQRILAWPSLVWSGL